MIVNIKSPLSQWLWENLNELSTVGKQNEIRSVDEDLHLKMLTDSKVSLKAYGWCSLTVPQRSGLSYFPFEKEKSQREEGEQNDSLYDSTLHNYIDQAPLSVTITHFRLIIYRDVNNFHKEDN